MFLYFVPAGHTPRECGLQYALDLVPGKASKSPHVRKVLANGPDGGPGEVYTYAEQGIGYYAEHQTWSKIHGSAAWLGMQNDTKITPDELARSPQLSGRWVTLADDQDWLLPVARKPTIVDAELRWQVALPQKLEQCDGVWQYGSVEEKYRALYDICGKWSELRWAAEPVDGGDAVGVDLQTIGKWSAYAMGFNYRVGESELHALGLLNNVNKTVIVDTLFDIHGLVELFGYLDQKKTTTACSVSQGDMLTTNAG